MGHGKEVSLAGYRMTAITSNKSILNLLHPLTLSYGFGDISKDTIGQEEWGDWSTFRFSDTEAPGI